MRRYRRLKTALVLLFVATVGMVAWSFLNRTRAIREIQGQAERLASDVARLAKGFEYTESRDGRPVFKVIAGRSLEFRQGTHVLESVEVYKYDREGGVADFVKSGKAIYDPQRKHVQFSMQVELKMANGITVRAADMNADIAAEQLDIPGGYVFESGGFSGEGAMLSYDMKARRIHMRDGAQFTSGERGKGARTARADEATLLMLENRIRLQGDVRVAQADSVLTANRLDLGFNFETRQVERIEGHEVNAAFTSPRSSRRLTAQSVTIPVTGGHVLSFQASGQTVPARLELEEPGVHRRLEAATISAALDASGNFTALDGSREVLLTDLPNGVRIEAESARTRFSSGRMESSAFSGRVRLEEPSDGLRITADSVDLAFGATGVVSRFDARGQAKVIKAGKSAGSQELSADRLEGGIGSGGRLSRLTGTGHAILRAAIAGAADRTVSAGQIAGEFDAAGELRAVWAEGQTALVVGEGDSRREMRADRLEARLGAGQITWFRQGPNFRMRQQDSVVTGDEAVYQDGLVTISGGSTPPSLVRPDSTTTAVRLIANERDGSLIARGDVRTELRANSSTPVPFPTFAAAQPVQVRADSAEIAQQQAVFRGKVKAYQANDFLFADSITLRGDALSAAGAVRTVLYRSSRGQLERLAVEAKRLAYDGQKRTATYQEDVRMSGPDVSVSAQSLELRFDADHRVRQGLARQNVTVRQAGRTGTGEAAEYDFDADRIVLTGNLAQVVDPARGRSRGRRLTFYLGSDKILVES